jgi:CRISPR/Cas system CSM-associated protein Csm2 small subunit
MTDSVSGSHPECGKYSLQHGGLLQRVVLSPTSERHNYGAAASILKLSDYASEEEKLRRLYDQARAQGNKKKKKEYKEKIAELNRLRKSAKRESNRSKSQVQPG